MMPSNDSEQTATLRTADDRIQEVVRRVGLSLQMPIDSSQLDLGGIALAEREADDFGLLLAGARQSGVYLKESKPDQAEIVDFLAAGFPVILATEDGRFWVLEHLVGRRVEASCIAASVTFSMLRKSQLRDLLKQSPTMRIFVAKKDLECDTLSQAQVHLGRQPGGLPHHPKPLRRFIALLRLDQRDVWTVCLFALVAGLLALATPLAIESLVNVVSWGTYLQPLLLLALMLLVCLGLAAVLEILQTLVVEIIQRRQLVRIVGDLAHRFPRANPRALELHYPREFANRVFDIMTIQKASAVLLLDGIGIVLATIVGLLLLAFYHPYLLGFDLVLLISMLSMTWLLGRGGVSTAVEESITKYKIVHWLQDVLACPSAFKVNGGEPLAIERANRLTTEYIAARQRQFRVVIRQVSFALGLQVIASTVLLGLGGWLVIRQQLTLGQLVASELVVTVVVGAFAKAAKLLEKFYDLLAAIDKVGYLLDIPVDPRFEFGELPAGPVEVRWEELSFHHAATNISCGIRSARVAAGSRVAIIGSDRSGKSLLLKSLAGLLEPQSGIIEVGGYEAQRAALAGRGNFVGYAAGAEIFQATLQENVDLGRGDIGQNRVREVLSQVGLWDCVLRLPQGVRTPLQTEGAPLSKTQRAQLCIARAMAGSPRLLLLDGVLDELTPKALDTVWVSLAAADAPWTLLVVTNHSEIAKRCTTQIDLEQA